MTKRLRKKYLKIYAHILPDLLPSYRGRTLIFASTNFMKLKMKSTLNSTEWGMMAGELPRCAACKRISNNETDAELAPVFIILFSISIDILSRLCYYNGVER